MSDASQSLVSILVGKKVVKKTYVIAISSVSGGGKTALAELLVASLPDAVLFRFDDFDDTNVYPEDFCAANMMDFDCPGLAASVRNLLVRGTAAFIVLDYPFGREHPCFGDAIDLSVFIDTPLDVAMARRILRDFCATTELPPVERLAALKCDLVHYLSKSRDSYLEHYRFRNSSDLVLDGSASLQQLCYQILKRVESRT